MEQHTTAHNLSHSLAISGRMLIKNLRDSPEMKCLHSSIGHILTETQKINPIESYTLEMICTLDNHTRIRSKHGFTENESRMTSDRSPIQKATAYHSHFISHIPNSSDI
jgi:hypothetical protein